MFGETLANGFPKLFNMKKQTALSKEQLRKAAHAAAQRKYYAKKTGKPERTVRKIEREQQTISKTLKKTQAELDSEHAHRLAQRKYTARKKLKEAEQKGATKKELKKLFRKTVDANTEQKNFSKPKTRSGKAGARARRKKGKIYESYTVWGAKDMVDKVMSGAIKYDLYLGENFSENVNEFYEEATALIYTMQSRDIFIMVVDVEEDNIEDMYIKEAKETEE